MKPLKELRKIDFKLSSTQLFFSKVKDLPKRKIDMDVYLPSKDMNLQRDFVWDIHQKQQLIMSVFLERYIPYICVASLIDGDNDKLQIIDGKQRLSTFISFLNDEFNVKLEDRYYLLSELPEDYRRAFLNHDVFCQTAYEQFDRIFTDEDKIYWFSRINFYGTPQELNHLIKLQ